MANEAGIQFLIGAALTDPSVLDQLLHHPLRLAERFDLTLSERRFLAAARPRDLEHFAQLVEEWLGAPPPLGRSATGIDRRTRLAG